MNQTAVLRPLDDDDFMLRLRTLSIVLFCLFVSACQSNEVYSGLSQRDANEMVALLTRNGIEATRQLDGTTYRLTVGDNQFSTAIDLLKRGGYPREAYRSLAEIFPGTGLVVSPYEQRARMMYAQNQELAHTISDIEGVLETRVHVVVPELDLRGYPQTKSTAAVVVHHRAGMDTGELASKIRTMVANAVQGLNYRDVSISFFQDGDGTTLNPSPVVASTGVGSSTVVSAPGSGSEPSSSPWPRVVPMEAPTALMRARTYASYVLWTLAGIAALAGMTFMVLGTMGVRLGKRRAEPAQIGQNGSAFSDDDES